MEKGWRTKKKTRIYKDRGKGEREPALEWHAWTAKRAGEKAALPFTLKPAPLLSVLHNRKLKKNKWQKKTKQGGERERKGWQDRTSKLHFCDVSGKSVAVSGQWSYSPHRAAVLSEGWKSLQREGELGHWFEERNERRVERGLLDRKR